MIHAGWAIWYVDAYMSRIPWPEPDSSLNNSIVIPFGFAVLFICVQILHLSISSFSKLYTFARTRSADTRREDQATHSAYRNPHPPSTFYYLASQDKAKDGLVIFGYTLARLLGCLALLGLSMKTLLDCSDIRLHGTHLDLVHTFTECPEAFMTVTYLYSSALSILSMSVRRWTALATRYNIVLLLSALSVYLYRDVWPLATYTQSPVDSHDDVLWFKITALAFTSVVIPLFVPRRYIPVDPKNPMPVPNPEQTCSIFSLVFYFYLDPVIFMGYRVKHLETEQLPPLSDTDHSINLVKKAFPHLDTRKGEKKRHIFFGLMTVLWQEYTTLTFIMVAQVILGLFPAVGINRIIHYLETGGQNAFVHPWFWIISMAISHTFDSAVSQWYLFIITKALAHVEALMTQLVFEHSLRIRFIADTNEGSEVVIDDSKSTTSANYSGELPEASTTASSTEAAHVTTEAETRSSSPGSMTATASSATKGKSKDTSPPPATSKSSAKEEKKGSGKEDTNLIGKINNFVTTDLRNITDARDFLHLFVKVPLEIGCSIAFLYVILGWSALVGLAVILILFPLPGYSMTLLRGVQERRMKMTDARVQSVTEVVNVLKMIKLFGWEKKMLSRIEDNRREELTAVWKFKVLSIVTGFTNEIISTLTMVTTYATYTLIMKQSLTPSIVFSSVTVFNTLRNQLYTVTWEMSTTVQGKVSLDRVTEFLQKTELLDSFSETNPTALAPSPDSSSSQNSIGFGHATFSWRVESDRDETITSSRRRSYRLRIDDLIFKENCINIITGPTGSGKTSILMALLGEMHFIRTHESESWFNLPREGGIAYAPQESWVFNATIRENILFGSPYDEARYRKVLYQCALERDLKLFAAGDATEVGEKGITLSGGQKARVTLARAIYSQAKVILLDDILAALDVHTFIWIVNRCLRGDLVRERTVLLVTHNVALVGPLAGLIVSLSPDGKVKTSENKDFALADSETEEIELEEQLESTLSKNEAPASGKLVVAEEIAQGHVTWKSIKLFLSPLGGNSYPFIIFFLLLGTRIVADWFETFQTWFLGYWGTQYQNHDPNEVNVFFYLSLYCSVVFASMALGFASQAFYNYRSIKASSAINTVLMKSVLSSTLRWLDETPMSRILARCTQDIRAVDGPLAGSFYALVFLGIRMITNLGIVILFSPLFLFPGIGIMMVGMYLGNIYLRAQLSVKREMSNAKAPVLGHFSAAISGIVSVRAYGAQSAFKNESFKRIDHYLRVMRISYNLNRWIRVRIDALGTIFTAAISWYLVYETSIGASNTGFSLNMSLGFCSMILFFVRFFNDCEVQSNSLERIQQYIDIDHEPPSTEEGKPPAAWPTSGEIVVENLSARYSKDGPNVLHGLSFRIESGQRVGVVGRTGSGKSSLTLALLRCILTEGTVYYDGIPTSKVNLDALRSNITIIPQTPELISGTLRRNLDPFAQYHDATLNDALRSAGFFSVHEELGEGHISLDSNISSGGANFSVGEKQIIALARAMVRGSKLLILDEATSAIDYKTDAVIQTTLRHKLGSGVTVITVAHRLQTIMDADKIMLLDEGQIVEFDTPKALLSKDGSKFKAMVDGSGDKEALYAMAK